MKSGKAPGWHFNERRRGDKNREPIVGEFFATDVIRNSGLYDEEGWN
jgi:hypothetical protein